MKDQQIDADADDDIDSLTNFVYDGNQIALEFDGAADTDLTNRYVWGATVDQLLADEKVTSLGSAGNVIWPLTDHLGTIRDLAEYTNGPDTTAVENHIRYDSFGNIIDESDDGLTHLFGFTGRAFDKDSGLQNNLERWYDARTGNWMSEDPIGFKAHDPNLFRYVSNSPLTFKDPTGTTIEYNVAIVISQTTNKKHRKEVDAVVDKAIAILKNFDIDLKVDVVVGPNVLKVAGGAFGIGADQHSLTGQSPPTAGEECIRYIIKKWSDPAFLKAERKGTKAKAVIILFFAGNAAPGRSYPTDAEDEVEGALVNVGRTIEEHGEDGVTIAARDLAHEILAHLIIGYLHPTAGKESAFQKGMEIGITKSGVKDDASCELISKTAAEQLRIIDKSLSINPKFIVVIPSARSNTQKK